eukprot:70276_1
MPIDKSHKVMGNFRCYNTDSYNLIFKKYLKLNIIYMALCFKLTVFIAITAISIPFIYKYKDHREYNYRTTAEDALANKDLTGTTIIVTGSNTGIGKSTVKVLLSHGAQVIMACRHRTKAVYAAEDIMDSIVSSKECTSGAQTSTICDEVQLEDNLDIMILDLASLDSIDAFAKQFQNKYVNLNYLILNAGISLTEWTATKDGIETVFGVNHVGHHYLTMKLTPMLTRTAQVSKQISRVIALSSAAHAISPRNITEWLMDDKKIQSAADFGYTRYGFSKLCNILFAMEYNKRFRHQNVYAVSVHPGVIYTELSRNRPRLFRWVKQIAAPMVLKTWSQGAATTVRTVALSDEEFSAHGGSYFVDCNVANHQLWIEQSERNKLQTLLWDLTNRILKEKGKDVDTLEQTHEHE